MWFPLYTLITYDSIELNMFDVHVLNIRYTSASCIEYYISDFAIFFALI